MISIIRTSDMVSNTRTTGAVNALLGFSSESEHSTIDSRQEHL